MLLCIMMNEGEQTAQPMQNGQQVVYQVVERKKSPWRAFWLLLTAFFLVCGMCGIVPIVLLNMTDSTGTASVNTGEYQFVRGKEESKNELLAIYIDQPILTSSQEYADDVLSSLLVGQYVFGYEIKDELMKAATKETVKGVVFFINSPGGTIVGARAIADGVSYYREMTGKPVYAYVEDMAASGAYWAAASADKIYAEKGSLTGSIGVIFGPFEYYDKLVTLGGVGTANGISINYITGGKYKDLGNPTRKITTEELAILQKGIDSEYKGFTEYVSQRRSIPVDTITNDIKALVYGAEEARSYGLVDEIGNREDVLKALSTAAGVGDDYKLVKIGTQTSLFGSLFAKLTAPNYSASDAPARQCVLCGRPLYFYGNPLDY